MPFWDRTIDLVILTHAEADHLAVYGVAVGVDHMGTRGGLPFFTEAVAAR